MESKTDACPESLQVPATAQEQPDACPPPYLRCDDLSLRYHVRDGDTIGRYHYRDRQPPDIRVPSSRAFRYFSQLQGRCECRDGSWVFVQLGGTNPTDIYREGQLVFTLDQGQAAPLEVGDEIAVYDSPRLRVSRA